MKLSRCGQLGWLIAIVVARGAAAGETDTVVLEGNKQIFGEVVQDSVDSVVIKINQGRITRTIKGEQVETVYYGDQPRDYRDGRRLLEAGEYADAAASLRAALKAEARPWLRVYAPFYLAESLALDRRYDAALDAYRQCLAADAKSRFCFQARLGIALCQFAAGQYGEAVAAFEAIARDAPGEKLQVIAELSTANVLLLQDKADQARAIYQRVRSKAKEDELAAGTSDLGLALIAATLKAPGSDALLEKTLKGPSAAVLKYLAWHERARKAFEGAQYEVAMQGYLRADFYVSRGGGGGSFAGQALDVAAAPGDRGEMLFRAGSCAELLKKANEAVKLYEAVQAVAREGDWATKAGQRLKALQ